MRLSRSTMRMRGSSRCTRESCTCFCRRSVWAKKSRLIGRRQRLMSCSKSYKSWRISYQKRLQWLQGLVAQEVVNLGEAWWTEHLNNLNAPWAELHLSHPQPPLCNSLARLLTIQDCRLRSLHALHVHHAQRLSTTPTRTSEDRHP